LPIFLVPRKFRKFRKFDRHSGWAGRHDRRCTGLTQPVVLMPRKFGKFGTFDPEEATPAASRSDSWFPAALALPAPACSF
jgi:hypothetical protein